MTPREALLKKVAAADFALFELHLYLDTHAFDQQALEIYEKYRAKAALLRREYEENYGPISFGTAAGAEWLKDPWPWDTEGSYRHV